MKLETRKQIKSKLLKKWDNGNLLKNEHQLFPMQINLTSINSSQAAMYYLEIQNWIEDIKQGSKEKVGYGYHILQKEVNFRTIGKNTIPYKIQIDTIIDYCKFIGVYPEYLSFTKNKEKLIHHFPNIEAWCNHNPRIVMQVTDEIVNIANYFLHNDVQGLYMRQLCIHGVDTKYIETHKKVIEPLLFEILPEDKINVEGKRFETKFYLSTKPTYVRIRNLSKNNILNGFQDCSIVLNDFETIEFNFKYIFFVENEINFLTFPSVEEGCVIFSKGYGIESFKNVTWLKKKKIYYWGDIDTHGYKILSIARSIFPNTESFLMNEAILQQHQAMWVKEEKPTLMSLPNLTNEEAKVLYALQSNQYGINVRLEQERIDYQYVLDVVQMIQNNAEYCSSL